MKRPLPTIDQEPFSSLFLAQKLTRSGITNLTSTTARCDPVKHPPMRRLALRNCVSSVPARRGQVRPSSTSYRAAPEETLGIDRALLARNHPGCHANIDQGFALDPEVKIRRHSGEVVSGADMDRITSFPTPRRLKARCTPVTTTATQQCSWARPTLSCRDPQLRRRLHHRSTGLVCGARLCPGAGGGPPPVARMT
jgi:hypothetical protein